MSAWYSLSGYLYYRPGGALGKLKVRRRYWYLFEESCCQLVGYRHQDEAVSPNAQPVHVIDMSTAGITLSLTEANQFILICDGKEHVFTAENHEAMMIWLIRLQAKRDAYVVKSLPNAAPEEEVPQGKEDAVAFTEGRVHFKSQSASKFRQTLRLKHHLGDSVDAGLDLYRNQDSISSSVEKKVSRSLGELLDEHDGAGFYDNYVEVFLSNDASVETLDERDVTGTPEVPTRWRFMRKAASDITDSKITAYHARDQPRPISRQSVSSDSVFDHTSDSELSLKVADLEQELIDIKYELADMKTRESCYKAVLEKRDSLILNLDEKLEILKEQKWDEKTAEKNLKEQLRALQNQNHLLNEEVRKVAKLRCHDHEIQQAYVSQIEGLETEMRRWRQDYLYLLQTSVSVPTGDLSDGMAVKFFGGNRHRERIQSLLAEARVTNPSLPTYERLAKSDVHVDSYGFKHCYDNEGMLLHYLCQQLRHFYTTQLATYHKQQQQWKDILTRAKTSLVKTKELKVLCRAGIPPQYRGDMWRHLVNHHVGEIKAEKGPCYYSNLCRNAHDSEVAGKYRKQISLDLLRTMPLNVNFNTTSSQGVQRLQEVLLAFCLHNTGVGYCQGMNFLTATALLFMDAEDAFWTLVAVTEKYFTPSYFDAYLSGAQADQDVLKDIMKVTLPDLYSHLVSLDIDISTVTLNWFLAIFFDAVPFEGLSEVERSARHGAVSAPSGDSGSREEGTGLGEVLTTKDKIKQEELEAKLSFILTLLRIWDCFLLEGPKVLFRFSLAILKIHEPSLLLKTDTLSVMRHLKSCAGLAFDVDGLVKVAFEDLSPVPRRQDIVAKQALYMRSLKERLKKKAVFRQVFDEKEQMFRAVEQGDPAHIRVFECAAPCQNGAVWVCYGEQTLGRIGRIICEDSLMYSVDVKLETRIMCICSVGDLVVIGTLSGCVMVYDATHQEDLWQVWLHDSVLALCCHLGEGDGNKVFAALADGTVAVLENVTEKDPETDPFYVPVGRSPVTSLAMIDSQLWCACGSRVHILHAETLDTMDHFVVSRNPFEHVLLLVTVPQGLWVAVKGSSVIELWDHKHLTCHLLFDVRVNRPVPVRKDDDGHLNLSRITTLLPVEDTLWVGTGDGYLIIYDVITHYGNQPAKSARTRNSHSVPKSELTDPDKIDVDEECQERNQQNPRCPHKKSSALNTDLSDPRKRRKTRLKKAPHVKESESNEKVDSSLDKNVFNSKTSNKTETTLTLARAELEHLSERDAIVTNGYPSSESDAPSERSETDENANSETILKPDPKTGVLGLQVEDHHRNENEKLHCKKINQKEGMESDTHKRGDESWSYQAKNDANKELSNSTVSKKSSKELKRQTPSFIISSGHDNSLDGIGDRGPDGDGIKGQPAIYSSHETCTKRFVDGGSVLSQVLRRAQSRQALPPGESMVTGEMTLLSGKDGSFAQTLSPVTESAEEPDIEAASESRVGDKKPMYALSPSQSTGLSITVDPNVLQTPSIPGLSPISECSETSCGKASPEYRSENLSCADSPSEAVSSPSSGSGSDCDVSSMTSNVADDGSVHSADDNGDGRVPTVPRNTPVDQSYLSAICRDASRRRTGHARSSSDASTELLISYELSLAAKIKIADKPIRCLVLTMSEDEPVIISCAGSQGDDEAVLKWRKEPDEKLWTNEPVLEVCVETNRPLTPRYLRSLSLSATDTLQTKPRKARAHST